MQIEIREVQTRRERKQFVDFVNKLYELNPYFCPLLRNDALEVFDVKNNASLDVCDTVFYLAFIDNKPVGRIAGMINRAANEAWSNKRVRFGFFDFIDDQRVSHALLSKVEEWGKAQGMTELNGPVGFTDFDPQGLLVEGFDEKSNVVALYNYPYYQTHIESYGLRKDADWLEFQVQPPHEVPEKMARVGKIIQEKYNLKIVKVKSIKEFQEKYATACIDLVDLAYQPLYNFQPLTRRQKTLFCEKQFPYLNLDFLTIITTQDDEVIGLGAGLPDVGDAVRACKGRLFPFGWYKVLKALNAKQIDAFDLLLIAVHPRYQGKGVNSLFFIDQIPYVRKYNIQRMELSAILEVNVKSLTTFTDLDKRQHKRRRAYVKEI